MSSVRTRFLRPQATWKPRRCTAVIRSDRMHIGWRNKFVNFRQKWKIRKSKTHGYRMSVSTGSAVVLLLHREKKKRKNKTKNRRVDIALLLIVMLRIKHLRQHFMVSFFFSSTTLLFGLLLFTAEFPVVYPSLRLSVVVLCCGDGSLSHPQPPRLFPSQALHRPPLCLSIPRCGSGGTIGDVVLL